MNSNGIGTPSSSSLALSRRSLSGSVPGAISEAEPVPDSLLPASSLDVTASHVIASSLGTTEFVDPLTGHVTRHSLESLTWHRAGLDLDLPEAEREGLRHVAALVAGLCRQFWRSIPVREGDASGRQWVERLKDALEKKLVEVKTLSGKANGAERRHVRQLLRPPREMLEAALQRYDMGVCLTDAALARSRPFKA
uniref:Uncharacterized protein n=1 Tax=Polytomella parva TaxID=51329 RepID=A0A7S0UU54_9CHLO